MAENVKMGQIFKVGTLADTNPVVFAMSGAPMPCNVTLKSSASGRKVEFSTDGGTEYFTPTYDVTSTTMIVVNVLSTLTNVRVTGQAADTYRVS